MGECGRWSRARALAFGLLLARCSLGEGLAIVDVDVDAEPVEDVAGLVADGLGAEPPPAGVAVVCTKHAGFDVEVGPGSDALMPCVVHALAVVRVEGFEPRLASEVLLCEAHRIEHDLVGVGDSAIVGGSHPDGLRVEIGEDAVTFFAGGQRLFIALAIGDVDGEAAQTGCDAVDDEGLPAGLDPQDGA